MPDTPTGGGSDPNGEPLPGLDDDSSPEEVRDAWHRADRESTHHESVDEDDLGGNDDLEEDPDDFRMIDEPVTVVAGGPDMELEAQESFYQPSGNQQMTAGKLGLNRLGPALVIVPAIAIVVTSVVVLSGDPDPSDQCDPGNPTAACEQFVGECVDGSASASCDGVGDVATPTSLQTAGQATGTTLDEQPAGGGAAATTTTVPKPTTTATTQPEAQTDGLAPNQILLGGLVGIPIGDTPAFEQFFAVTLLPPSWIALNDDDDSIVARRLILDGFPGLTNLMTDAELVQEPTGQSSVGGVFRLEDDVIVLVTIGSDGQFYVEVYALRLSPCNGYPTTCSTVIVDGVTAGLPADSDAGGLLTDLFVYLTQPPTQEAATEYLWFTYFEGRVEVQTP